ncbi:glycosyltransferase [Algoriphagus litoralis]|uniref:glycosyltransferase n=1 Tax=Algoriphagus litoralis TaxID=2202829 RepID=UPI000DB96869|nr:glycosyltransferase [Algoriphagus litoralis]
MMIDVSIILLTYNQELFINECINSILSQKFNRSFEIIICDDCSFDNTFSIIEKLTLNIDNILLIRNEQNLGLAKNYQNAIELANGRYIVYLEGDDYWTDSLKIQKQFDALEVNPNFSLAFHDFVYVDQNSNLISDSNLRKKELRVNRTVPEMISGCLIHQNTIMFRNKFKKIPIWFFFAKNHDTWILAYLSNWGPSLYVDLAPLHYRILKNSLWSSLPHFNKQLNGLITIFSIFPIIQIKYYSILFKKLVSKVIQIIKLLFK